MGACFKVISSNSIKFRFQFARFQYTAPSDRADGHDQQFSQDGGRAYDVAVHAAETFV
jgi:hypothetical protein